jgi:hypothetical protein
MPPRAFLPPRRGQVFTPLRVLRVAPLLARPFLAHFKLTAAQPALCGATHSAGYKASFAQGVTEAGCLAHARRKYFDLHATNKSQIAEFALTGSSLLTHASCQLRSNLRETRMTSWQILDLFPFIRRFRVSVSRVHYV